MGVAVRTRTPETITRQRQAAAPAAKRGRMRWRMGVEARALLMLSAILIVFGLAVLYSASAIVAMQPPYNGSTYFLLRQIVGVLAGALIFAFVAKFDAEKLQRWAWPLMGLTLFLMLLVILPFTESIAPRVHGSRRFLFGSSLQPTELAKLAVVVWTAMLTIKKGPALRRLTKGLLPFLLVIGTLSFLSILEPDLSSALMFMLLMGVILFAGGARIGHFVLLGILAVPLLWKQVERLQYVLLRTLSFLEHDAAPAELGYQLHQSMMGVGSGQVTGVGFGQGRQQYGFLPLPYNDFIASNIGEEWGFLGMLFLIGAFALFGWLGFRIARKARTPFLSLVAIGLTVTIVVTAFLHIGVVVGALPTTGLNLPFISYGRSSLILTMIMTGILVNIGSSRERVEEGGTDPTAA